MNKQIEKQAIEEMRKDLIEIFDEEYEKRRLITPQNTAEKMTAKGYRKQSKGEWIDAAIEQIIRKKARVSEYWQNDVKQYRAMQGYSNIERDVDNFLRGYGEAIEDIIKILDGAKMKGGEEK